MNLSQLFFASLFSLTLSPVTLGALLLLEERVRLLSHDGAAAFFLLLRLLVHLDYLRLLTCGCGRRGHGRLHHIHHSLAAVLGGCGGVGGGGGGGVGGGGGGGGSSSSGAAAATTTVLIQLLVTNVRLILQFALSPQPQKLLCLLTELALRTEWVVPTLVVRTAIKEKRS